MARIRAKPHFSFRAIGAWLTMAATGWKTDIARCPAELHHPAVDTQSLRAALAARACMAHLIGLIVVGFYGTVGTSGGFGSGAWAGILAGGIISIPWFAALIMVIWFFASFYQRSVVLMCFIGPLIVCGSWWLLDGTGLLDTGFE